MDGLRFVIAPGASMDEPIEKSFVQQMRDSLQKQLSEFEAAQKKQHDGKILADEGAKTWSKLTDSLKRHVEEINDGLSEAMLSYSETRVATNSPSDMS